jgi:ATP:ADP antiporter, AAA family
MSLLQRALAHVAEIRREERATTLLMFCYSFLAMAAWNMVKPATRSQFIDSLGAENLPYVQLVAGLIMGFVIQGYTAAMRLLPRRWIFAATQVVMVVLLVTFWSLFTTGERWVPVAFYLWGVLAGSLLISQFWSLANDIYNARQAKRLFGFIGGGASLGSVAGSGISGYAKRIGTNNLLLLAAVALGLCFVVAWAIAAREKPAGRDVPAGDEKSMSPREAIRLLVASRHFRLIALVISFAAIGAGIIEQQLNMAVQEWIPGKDARTAYLGNVIFYSSIAGFIIQMTLTTRVHRLLGIGFALLLLPTSLGATAALMLTIRGLWTSTVARVLDTSLRYTVDKTTREILFMPLPTAMKYKAKPFADVAIDRFAKGVGAALALIIAIKVFHATWWQLSYLSVGVTALWLVMAVRARAEYLRSFRRSLDTREMDPAELRLNAADLSTIETLVQELSHTDPGRVLYAIDVLESLDKRHLVTPLLLHHDSAPVRCRALAAIGAVRSEIAQQWVPQIKRLLADPDLGVRAAAISALTAVGNEEIAAVARRMLSDPEPRIRVAAAVALASSPRITDLDLAEAILLELASDAEESGVAARREVAAAIRQIPHSRFQRLLIPLLYDPSREVAHEAMESVRGAGAADFVFVPTLVALLASRHLKGQSRRILVGYGEPVIDILAHFMRSPDEDVWVRRHIPATLAQIPTQHSADVLVEALDEPDGFLRFKVVAALERLRREAPDVNVPPARIETLTIREARAYFDALSLHHNLVVRGGMPPDSTLARALAEKQERVKDRLYRLLSLVHPWKDVAAARWTLQHGDARSRASASEYLDNVLGGRVRKHVMPILDDLPAEERVRRGNLLLRTRPRDSEETLLRLINDDDQVIAATAIDAVRRQKLWALAEDIEHVLAHRDVRDWYVFEAASGALAERRMSPERRRDLWLEPLPAAELAGRLRELPLFASVGVDELFRIASAARQTRHEPGVVLLAEGTIPDTLHLLLDGRVTAARRDGGVRTIDGCAALGMDEALRGQPMGETIRTAGITVTLALTTEELQTLLSDSTDLVTGLFATILGRGGAHDEFVMRSLGTAAELTDLARGGLTAIDRVLALRRVPLFACLSSEEMGHLASIARSVIAKAGERLFDESSAPALWLVLAGEVVLESSTGAAPARATPGEVFGLTQTMAGRALGRTGRAATDAVLLRIDREGLFDLLADRSGMLRQIFAALFRGAEREYSSASWNIDSRKRS